MPITPDRLSRLREFGLSEYAARAYLALLDLGVAEARDVSTLSKVPQAKIYHVLEQLHDKGLATILPEFPKKYAPVPFSDYLNRIHEEHQRAADAIHRDREVLEDMFRVVGDTEVGNRGFFTVVRGRRNVVAKISEMLQEAKSDMLVMGTSGFALRYAHFLPELNEAKRRGVRLRVLAPLTEETLPKLTPVGATVEVRARRLDEGAATSRVAILTIDRSRAFLINFLPDDDNLYTGKDIGVFTDQEAMVRALESLVEAQWDAAVALEAHAARNADARITPADVGLGKLFAITRDAVLVTTLEGTIALANPAAQALLGARPGAPLRDLVPEPDRLLASEDAVTAPTRFVGADGDLHDAEATAAPLSDASGRRYCLLALRPLHGKLVPVDAERAARTRTA